MLLHNHTETQKYNGFFPEPLPHPQNPVTGTPSEANIMGQSSPKLNSLQSHVVFCLAIGQKVHHWCFCRMCDQAPTPSLHNTDNNQTNADENITSMETEQKMFQDRDRYFCINLQENRYSSPPPPNTDTKQTRLHVQQWKRTSSSVCR